MKKFKHFECINNGVNISPLLEEIGSQPEAFLIDTGRQEKVHVQRKTQTIKIRNPVVRQDLFAEQNQETEWSTLAPRFPKACAFMEAVAKEQEGSLSRAFIVRLQPKSQVDPHIDAGAYYAIRKRFHLILKSAGSIMIAGDERVTMMPGELWWFDHRQHHAAANTSDEWRIHYIFDVLPDKYKELAYNPDLTSKYIKPA